MMNRKTLMEEVVAKSRYYPAIPLEGMRKTTKTSVRISGIPPEIRNEHTPNVNPVRYL
jgi:hypothetical protein